MRPVSGTKISCSRWRASHRLIQFVGNSKPESYFQMNNMKWILRMLRRDPKPSASRVWIPDLWLDNVFLIFSVDLVLLACSLCYFDKESAPNFKLSRICLFVLFFRNKFISTFFSVIVPLSLSFSDTHGGHPDKHLCFSGSKMTWCRLHVLYCNLQTHSR